MNPILLKPTSQKGSQVIVNGEVWEHLTAQDYYARKAELWPYVKAAYDRLAATHDIVVVEGAGSPAEINLRENDFVNAGLATRLQIPCILVGDIDRGVYLLHLWHGGCSSLLNRIDKALLINKFRGDMSILEPGCRQIEVPTGRPVIGCVPMTDVVIEDEDSLSGSSKLLGKRVFLLRWILLWCDCGTNTDFNIFRHFSRINLRYVARTDQLGEPDLIILPGTKSTIEDLLWLRTNGLEAKILQAVDKGIPLIGICGGYQMLGEKLCDPLGIEQEPGTSVRGLGLLKTETTFARQKTRRQVKGYWNDLPITGYEVHAGQTRSTDPTQPSLFVMADGKPEGLMSPMAKSVARIFMAVSMHRE